MPKFRSFIQKIGPEGTTETPCFTCAHCNTIHEVPKKDSPFGFCEKCHHPLCIPCAATNRCTPFEKTIEKYEKRMAMLKTMEG